MTAKKARRITVTLPAALENSLKPLVEAGVFNTVNEAVLHGGKVLSYLSDQANDGFDHVTVTNDVGAKRHIILPELRTTKTEVKDDQ